MQKHSLEIFAGPVIWQPKFFVGGTDTQCVIYVGLQIPPSPTAKFGRPPNATRKNFLPLPALLIFIAVRAGVASALAMFALAALQTYVLMLHIPAVARETIHFLANLVLHIGAFRAYGEKIAIYSIPNNFRTVSPKASSFAKYLRI